MQAEPALATDRGSVHRHGGRGQETVDELAGRRRFNALIAPHLSPLRARARQLCRGSCDAEDLVQDTLLRAFRASNQVQDVTRARAWLLTILTHAFIDATRRRRRRPDTVPLLMESEVPASIPDEPAPWHDIGVDDLRDAIERLTVDVRDTYRMYALEGRDQAAIGETQKIATGTVASRIFRARKQLRVLLTAATRSRSAP
jgi:RNA polymerase sigma-70 factor, ECF subfamily